MHAVASGELVERVGHRTTLAFERGHQIAHQHRGADAVFVTHRGGVDAVPDRFLVGVHQGAGQVRIGARQPLKAGEGLHVHGSVMRGDRRQHPRRHHGAGHHPGFRRRRPVVGLRQDVIT
ncbi:Uncharacterised protein [Mycobacterium tuberculosis]|nr:Uncharacterised protein [Mycobacterium tuberculosis]